MDDRDETITIYESHSKGLDLFDNDGVCKLKFTTFEGSLSLMGIPQIKSLKNMPYIINGEFCINGLYNVSEFDLLIEKAYFLQIESSSFTDLSNIENTRKVILSQLHDITTFKQLPHFNTETYETDDSSLTLMNMTMNPQSGDNDDIFDLRMNNVNNIINFKNLPKHLIAIKYHAMKDFKNYIGIDEYKNLHTLFCDSTKYDNIITTLLCKKLSNFHTHKLCVPHNIEMILEKYFNIMTHKRSEHVMDCAVELIDAGYPEAAEL